MSGANGYTGLTTIGTGALNVTGSLAGAVSVASGATLAGNGTVTGTVTALAGGIIAPGNAGAGTLNTGALTLNNTSVLNYDVGSSTDLIAVTGALTLGGTINITSGSGFGTGTKAIITYTGALTNNGLSIGTTPGGNYSYAIDVTSTPNQINLVITASKWSVTSLGTINGGAITESVIYVGTGTPDNLNCRSLADGSVKWTYPTGHGACHSVSYNYNGTKYQVVASAVDWIIGQQDDGGSSSNLWPLPAYNFVGAGTPYVSYTGASLFVPYTGNLTMLNMANPATAPVNKAVANISTSADLVVANDYVYAATTTGIVDQFQATDSRRWGFMDQLPAAPVSTCRS